MEKWPKYSIWYILAFGLLWLFWQLFLDELASLAREHIPGGGIIMYSVTHPYIIMPSLLVLACLFILVRSQMKSKKEKGKSPTSDDSDNLTVILTEMHKRMMHLKDTRLKQRFDKQRFEDACPLFFDKLGIIPLKDWDNWDKKTAKGLKRLVPKDPEKKAKFEWRYKVIGKAQEMVKDLVNSKEWTIDDLEKAARHLDSIHMGIGESYDNDKQWQELFTKARPYMSDSILRELIDKHISHSYAFCSVLLVVSYGNRLAKNRFSRMLYSALTSSNISPHKIEIALGEILEEITERLKVLKQGKSFDGELTNAIRLKLDVGKLLLDGKEILVDLEKRYAQLDWSGAVSPELKCEMWYKDASKTLQNTDYDRLWFENKEGLDYRTANKSDYIEALKYGLDRLEYIKQLIFDKEGSQLSQVNGTQINVLPEPKPELKSVIQELESKFIHQDKRYSMLEIFDALRERFALGLTYPQVHGVLKSKLYRDAAWGIHSSDILAIFIQQGLIHSPSIDTNHSVLLDSHDTIPNYVYKLTDEGNLLARKLMSQKPKIDKEGY